MAALNTLIFICLLYAAGVFFVAFLAERASANGKAAWLRSPLVYTLSLSIYCTAWTFYGAVGFAATSGLEFATIYLGPSLVMLGWWWILRKLVRVGRAQRVTSIADLISSRYGKSNALAVLVTLMAVIGVTPYIALQLQSVTLSLSAFSDPDTGTALSRNTVGLWVASGLAVFTVLFGTRSLNASERHEGVVMAIAVEAVVKLIALLSVGVFVVWGLGGGPVEMMARIEESQLGTWQIERSRWVALTVLAAVAFLTLPRMFQVLVVENQDERHLQMASWAFPLYLMLMSLFVVPIAVVGLDLLPAGSNPDLFVLSIPLAEGRDGLAMFAFLGGFSSATSMVIVATLALSTMVSNHIVMPIWLNRQVQGASVSGDVRNVVILARRTSILVIMMLGYLYYSISGEGAALAAIGLISFVGVAQFLPAMIGGIFWRGASRPGALAGLAIGFLVWLYTSFLPSFGEGYFLSAATFAHGFLGFEWLRPRALFGIPGIDPTVHAVVWSLSLNTLAFILVSLFTFPTPLERLQGAQFVNVFDHSSAGPSWSASAATAEDLMIMSQRIMGAADARAIFKSAARAQGLAGDLPDPTPEFLERLERELAASVGAATAHAMISQLVGGMSVSVEDLMAVADESAQILEYSMQLEAKSTELSQTALQLREANDKLTVLSHQKDAFLSQISHELRTPMTSIRSFSEILIEGDDLLAKDKVRYASIIHDEARRLSRLLDDLLDLSVMENGQVSLNLERGALGDVLASVLQTAEAAGRRKIDISVIPSPPVHVKTDMDRLAQVFLNLVTNAQKYCDAKNPCLQIEISENQSGIAVTFLDNGTPIRENMREVIFEKFSRLDGQGETGAGLGLAICREIMLRLGGNVTYQATPHGNQFTVTLGAEMQVAAQ